MSPVLLEHYNELFHKRFCVIKFKNISVRVWLFQERYFSFGVTVV